MRRKENDNNGNCENTGKRNERRKSREEADARKSERDDEIKGEKRTWSQERKN